jgi:hypothetical protein
MAVEDANEGATFTLPNKFLNVTTHLTPSFSFLQYGWTVLLLLSSEIVSVVILYFCYVQKYPLERLLYVAFFDVDKRPKYSYKKMMITDSGSYGKL